MSAFERKQRAQRQAQEALIKDGQTFFIISSLSTDRSFDDLHRRQKFTTEKEAQEAAEKLVQHRREIGARELNFFILKAVSVVGVTRPPIETKKLK